MFGIENKLNVAVDTSYSLTLNIWEDYFGLFGDSKAKVFIF